MLKTSCFLALLLPALTCAAADFGVGVSTHSTVLVPIRVTEQVLLEPQFGWSKGRSDYDDGSWYKSRGWEIGLGAFVTVTKVQAAQGYVGMRLSQQKSSDSNTTGSSGEGTINTVVPTVGLQYLLAPNFSVAGEIGYGYRRYKSQSTSPTYGTASSTSYQQGIQSQLVLRYYFGQ